MIRNISYYTSQSIIGIAFLIMAVILGAWLTELPTKTFIFVILAILGAIISFFKPMIPLFLFFLFIPMETITVGPQQTVGKLVALYFGVLACIQIALTKKIVFPRNSKYLWILAFGVVAVLSLLVSQDPVESQRRAIRVWKFVAMYFLIIFFIRNVRTLNTGILFLVVGGFIAVIFNIIGVGVVKNMAKADLEREAGLLGDPNNFAAILLALIPLSLLLFFRAKNTFVKAITLGLFISLLVGFFDTFSRGGFIGLFVSVIYSVFKFNLLSWRSNKVRILGYMTLIVVICFIVFYPLAETYIARIETLVEPPSSQYATQSVSGRYTLYVMALNHFWEHPILGVGIRAFQSINPLGKVVHNTYLEVLSGMGLLGFIPFMAILFLSWRELKKIQNLWKQKGNKSSFIYQSAAALELGFIGYFVAATFLSLDLSEMTWLLITLSSVLWNLSLNEKEAVFYREERGTYLIR